MAEQKYTPIGSTVTRWKRLREVSVAARWVWLALYTGSEAKMCPTGLFFGSIYSIANAAGMTPQEADKAMHELVTAKLILWDVSNELVRLVELPDSLDRAHTEQAIHGWWGRFCNIPKCALRDSHVPQLRDMIMSGKVNDKMRDAWDRTFGTIDVPCNLPSLPPRSSSDTSTANQPSLFGEPTSGVPDPENGNPMKSGTVVLAARTGSGEGSGSGSEEGRAGSGAGSSVGSERVLSGTVVPGPWPVPQRLALVPAEPIRRPPDSKTESRNAYAEEMRRAREEAAAASGELDWLVPQKA